MPIAIFSSPDELSLIAPVNFLFSEAEKIQAQWKCFKIEGDMPFGTVQGLIAKISGHYILHK